MIHLLASGGAAPAFDAETLRSLVYTFASAILAGVGLLIGLVLVVRVPFALIRISQRAIDRVFGGVFVRIEDLDGTHYRRRGTRLDDYGDDA